MLLNEIQGVCVYIDDMRKNITKENIYENSKLKFITLLLHIQTHTHTPTSCVKPHIATAKVSYIR